MGRPDYGRMMRQQRNIAAWVGETATWRKAVSAQAGQPAYGVGDTPRFVERTVSGLFQPVTIEQITRAGGQLLAGDIQATLLDCAPTERDEVRWSGAIYRVEGQPVAVAIVGRDGWRVLLRRGGQS